MQATIKDVAKRAGVSVSTVSLVLNNRGPVSPETRERVLRAIEELGYHPRRFARSMASKRTGNIGFILTSDHFSRAEPFYTKIFLGSEFEARNYDYYILLTTVEKRGKSAGQLPRFLLERNVDGVIFAGYVPVSLVERVHELGVPFVLVDFYVKDRPYSSIVLDNEQAVRRAVGHLVVEHGHRRIAFVGGEIGHPSIRGRLEGYRKGLEDYGIARDPRLERTEEAHCTMDSGYRATRKMLEEGVDFTAVVTANDATAFGVMRALKEAGRAIPGDVAVIGFDDIDAASQVDPTLTTLRVPKEELGALALRRLVEVIERPGIAFDRTVVPTELVLRESCCGKKRAPRLMDLTKEKIILPEGGDEDEAQS
ncbi:MAG: LacI family transcriptional regulator [candidate division KSB1 bacterium]|nr:LacI family transcriptional regulator [candidate division KSB1 bacterium]